MVDSLLPPDELVYHGLTRLVLFDDKDFSNKRATLQEMIRAAPNDYAILYHLAQTDVEEYNSLPKDKKDDKLLDNAVNLFNTAYVKAEIINLDKKPDEYKKLVETDKQKIIEEIIKTLYKLVSDTTKPQQPRLEKTNTLLQYINLVEGKMSLAYTRVLERKANLLQVLGKYNEAKACYEKVYDNYRGLIEKTSDETQKKELMEKQEQVVLMIIETMRTENKSKQHNNPPKPPFASIFSQKKKVPETIEDKLSFNASFSTISEINEKCALVYLGENNIEFALIYLNKIMESTSSSKLQQVKDAVKEGDKQITGIDSSIQEEVVESTDVKSIITQSDTTLRERVQSLYKSLVFSIYDDTIAKQQFKKTFSLEDKCEAISGLTKYLSEDTDVLLRYAHVLYQLKRYDLSLSQYKKLITAHGIDNDIKRKANYMIMLNLFMLNKSDDAFTVAYELEPLFENGSSECLFVKCMIALDQCIKRNERDGRNILSGVGINLKKWKPTTDEFKLIKEQLNPYFLHVEKEDNNEIAEKG